MKKIIPPSSTSFQSTLPFWKGRNIIVFLILAFSYEKTFALELDTFDNLRMFFYFPNMIYNKWIDLYNKWDYEKRDFYFKMTKCSKNIDLCAKKLYNSWNANYRLWEKAIDKDLKQISWETAINDYSESLKYKFDEETKQNLDFVIQKLNELKNKKEEEKKKEKEKTKEEENKEEQKENPKEEKQKQEENKQEQEDKNEKWDKEQEQQIVKNGSMWLGWDEKSIQKLTASEEKELNEYYQKLKNEEKQNQEFFNKKNNSKKEESPFDQFISPFRFFQWDPFFDEIWWDDNKKDW